MKNRIHLKAPGNWINDPNGFILKGDKTPTSIGGE